MSSLNEVLGGQDLESALTNAINQVKAKPTDAESRYRLFALLAFSGDLHRARKQLEALGMGDEVMVRAKAVYINLLAAEQERRAVHHHQAEPLLPPDPPQHLQLRLSVLGADPGKDPEGNAAKLEQAVEVMPALKGTINGEPFGALRDLDDVLGTVLEVFAGGRHVLMPFERIHKLETKAPSHLLDLLWLPAQLTDTKGVESSVHLPALYVDSPQAEDPRALTGSITEWHDQGAEVYRGRGQRLLAWQDGEGQVQELPILALRNLERKLECSLEKD